MGRPERTTRRSFLKRAGAIAGGVVLAGAGLGFIGSRRPEADLVTNSFGGAHRMAPKVLVTYGSRCGSTGEIAEEVGKALASRGCAVDILPLKSVGGLMEYRAIVIGSAVRFGRWLPEAIQFCDANAEHLSRVPTAIFTAHLLAVDDSEESRQRREAYIAPLHGVVSPMTSAFFAGKMDFSRLSFIERMMTRAVKAEEGDLRDWAAIAAWGEGLPEALEIDTAPR